MATPLENVTVVSMAEQYPGPYCTLILADLGADVILVERPGQGDPARQLPPFFQALNRNKRSIAIDLKKTAGRDLVQRLVQHADVFLEGFRPGVAERLGMAYEILRALNPCVVYCSISGFGQDGPRRDLPAHDLTYQGMAGLLQDLIGRDEPDFQPPLSIADVASGLFAAIAILAGLAARDRTGQGTYVDVSMMDCLVSLMTTRLTPVLNRQGLEGIPPDPGYGVYRAGDGKLLTLSIAHEDHFWRQLCRTLGWEDAGRLSALERRACRGDLTARLAAALALKPREVWLEAFARAGVPAGPVLNVEEVADDQHLRARDLVAGAQDGRADALQYIRQPLKFSAYRSRIRRPAPALGEHTREVALQLGYSTQELASLEEAGVFQLGS